MVEGPGCKLKGQKIRAKLRGQSVREVDGNAVQKETKKSKGDGTSRFYQLIGRTMGDVQTLGKELFIYFGDLCLRVHFLMAGQSFINNTKVDNDFGGNAEADTMKITLSKDVLSFKKSSVDIRPTELCREKYKKLNDVDICSPVFNFQRAQTLVSQQQGRMVCDILLDQSILPGVGNIIKNEALFDSGIKPSCKVEELNMEHISHLIKMTRDFTNIFYQCRRDGKPLHPYMKIYSKQKCGQCQGKVTICRLGNDNDRLTYFCENCQSNDPKKIAKKLPTKNSLIGWVKTGSSLDSENQTQTTTTTPQSGTPLSTWSCDRCTLINPSTCSTCQVCLSTRVALGTSQSASLFDLTDQSVDRTYQQFGSQLDFSLVTDQPDPSTAQTKQARSLRHPNSGLVNNVTNGDLSSLSSLPKHPVNIRKRGSVDMNNGDTLSLITNKKARTGQGEATCGDIKSSRGTPPQPNQVQIVVTSKIIDCPTHKKKCSMKEVRKKGDNLGRFFFSCTQRSCNFFQWADTSFPICQGHGMPCTIRTVLKIGQNNGRKFFTCKMPKNKQCKFFEWAVGYE